MSSLLIKTTSEYQIKSLRFKLANKVKFVFVKETVSLRRDKKLLCTLYVNFLKIFMPPPQKKT